MSSPKPRKNPRNATYGWSLAAKIEFYSAPPDENGCVKWTGACDKNGYGILDWDGKTRKAHRLAWEEHNGPIPTGIHICHKCDVKPCIADAHLFPGTNADNHRDRAVKGLGAAKLSLREVLAIKSAPGRHWKIAADFGIGRAHVSAIKRGTRRRHITMEGA